MGMRTTIKNRKGSQVIQSKSRAKNQGSLHSVLQAYKDGSQTGNKKRGSAPTTIGESEVAGFMNPIVEWKRGTTLTATVNAVRQPYADGNDMHALVDAAATGLDPTDWVDYQIKWGSDAVPGYDGVQLHNPHLGQQIGQAGGWVTDRPPLNLGVLDPMVRAVNNPRYYHPNNARNWQGPNWDFRDLIVQDPNMAQGANNADRQWKFRAIVKNSWGVPIKASNEVTIQW